MRKKLLEQSEIAKDLLIAVYRIRKNITPDPKQTNLELFAGRVASTVRRIHKFDEAVENSTTVAEAQIQALAGRNLRRKQAGDTASITHFEFDENLKAELVKLRSDALREYNKFPPEVQQVAAAELVNKVKDDTAKDIRENFLKPNTEDEAELAKIQCTYYLKLFSDYDITISGLNSLLAAKADAKELAEVIGTAHKKIDLNKPYYADAQNSKLDFQIVFDKGETRVTDPQLLEGKHYPRVRERLLIRENLYDEKGEFDEYKLLMISDEGLKELTNKLRQQRDDWEKYIREGQQLSKLHPKRLGVMAKNACKGNVGSIVGGVFEFLGPKLVPLLLVFATSIGTFLGIRIGEKKQEKESEKLKVEERQPAVAPVNEEEKKLESQPKETSYNPSRGAVGKWSLQISGESRNDIEIT